MQINGDAYAKKIARILENALSQGVNGHALELVTELLSVTALIKAGPINKVLGRVVERGETFMLGGEND